MQARRGRQLATGAALALTPVSAFAQGEFIADVDNLPIMVAAGALILSVFAVLWAMRVSAARRHQSLRWSRKLAEMEARIEKSDAVLSAHPGLVLVWEDDNQSVKEGWGDPKILGGPAALASLLAFSTGEADAAAAPVDSLLGSLGGLPLKDDQSETPQTLKEKIHDLREHGVSFSGAVMTADGRSIDADGRVAGGQAALWLTDPAVRMAEDGAIIGTFRERAADLHGSHALLDRAPFPAWRRDADLALTWVNRAYGAAVEAASPAEAVAKQIELDPSVKKLASSAAAERKAQDGRIIANAAGARRVFRIIEAPLHGAGDAALGGFAIDATELDKTKTELREHIEANQRTLDQIQTAVAIFGASQNLIYHNRAFQELWGLEAASLGGRVYHGELLDQLRFDGKLPEPADYDAWRAGQLSLYSEELVAPGSAREGDAPDEIWNLPDARTLRVAKQRHPLGGVMLACEDITEKVKLEAQYNTQIKVQKATLNNLAEGVAVFSADGFLRLYNKAFEKLWRFNEKALQKKTHVDAVAAHFANRAPNAEAMIALVRRAATSKSPDDRQSHSQIEIALGDGRTLSFATEPLPDGATLAHFLDITDSKEREKELKERNAILEDADRLKSKFVDHVSYQLRTPLSTIIGFSEMLDSQMFGVLNERQEDYVASIQSASYHLRDLINDIIDLAAIDAGKLDLDKTPVDIRALLENTATFAALKAEDTQVALKVDCPKDIGAASIDERRVKQVMFNLLSNAFSYTGAGGAVTIGARRDDEVLKLWVEDNGRGVSPEDQAKVFDAFESRGPSAGAGLGLSLVERFVNLHGGWVRMDSREGQGARVTCYLPQSAQQTKPAAGDGDQAAGKRKDDPPAPAKQLRRRRAQKPKRADEAQHARRSPPPHAAE